MELGATVCSPQNPSCLICPAARICTAYKTKSWASLPFRKNREKLEKIGRAALILRKNGRVLVEKQPGDARWGGLWMFPHADDRKTVLEKFGLSDKSAKHKLTVLHGFTKYQVKLDVYESSGSLAMPAGEFRWARVKELEEIAFPSPHKKISLAVMKDHGL
jgi:A/G-specific adenine glycosylase